MSSSGVEHGEEIQEGKAQCLGAHEEKDEEGDAEKETGANAHAALINPSVWEGFAGANQKNA